MPKSLPPNPPEAAWRREVAALVEALPDPVAVIDAQTAQYVALNDAILALSAHTRDELMAGGPLLVSADAAGVTLEVLKRRYRMLVDAYPQPAVQGIVTTRSDGTLFHATVHRRAARLFGRWVIVVRVTPHAGLAESDAEAPFRSAVELSSDAVGIVDIEQLRLIDVNRGATELFGCDREALLAKGLSAELTGLSPHVWRRLFSRLIAQSPRARVIEAELRRRDGRTVPVQVTQQAFDDHGRWIAILTARDITERVEARRALEQRVQDLAHSNQELERFAYVVSHDLMEPLRMMASYSQLLDRRYRPQLDADAGEFIDFIVGGARRMKVLLDDLLAYSRVGRIRGKPAPVPMDDVLADVLANLQVRIAETHAAIRHGPLPVLRCDRTEMTQLLQNLVGNALKFQESGRPAEVRVDAVQDADGWTFSVADNGIGIEPQHFERIFALFQRLHGREQYGGTGIGLAICKKIVEAHGGRIWVESSPGQGATFKFTVPPGAS